ncbi:hypothetical protein PG999_004248 [Apiospora kogelbergensis]|uniref:Secreted protein n=1 Tax=Apiospora kogelbergensis TaxID=1337665 RepID=A0AAW0QYT2_9PEZI
MLLLLATSPFLSFLTICDPAYGIRGPVCHIANGPDSSIGHVADCTYGASGNICILPLPATPATPSKALPTVPTALSEEKVPGVSSAALTC